MRKLLTSITLCDQIFTLPIQWTAAMNFPKTATHHASPDAIRAKVSPKFQLASKLTPYQFTFQLPL